MRVEADESPVGKLLGRDMRGRGEFHECSAFGAVEVSDHDERIVDDRLAAQQALARLTRPLFVSSTFKDMQAERDYLRQVVFPRVEEELRKGRIQLEPIDLRQGGDGGSSQRRNSRRMIWSRARQEAEGPTAF